MDDKTLYQLIGQKIRRARQHMSDPKLSQEKLAGKLGLTRASIVNVEAGRQKPTIHTLWQIAEALGVELVDLVPRRAEYEAACSPAAAISEQTLAQIEQAMSDPVAKNRLVQFVISKAKATETQ